MGRGFIQVEVYEMIGKSVIEICERTEKGLQVLFIYLFAVNMVKLKRQGNVLPFSYLLIFKRQYIYSSQKGCSALI